MLASDEFGTGSSCLDRQGTCPEPGEVISEWHLYLFWARKKEHVTHDWFYVSTSTRMMLHKKKKILFENIQ